MRRDADLPDNRASRFEFGKLLILIGSTILTVAPWTLHCLREYPNEFWHEHAQVWRHLHGNVESWAAPWDRLVFDYMIAIYGVFYTPVIVAVVVLAAKAVDLLLRLFDHLAHLEVFGLRLTLEKGRERRRTRLKAYLDGQTLCVTLGKDVTRTCNVAQYLTDLVSLFFDVGDGGGASPDGHENHQYAGDAAHDAEQPTFAFR